MGRLVAVLAPEIGEMDEPLPMLLMAATAAACGISCFAVYVMSEKQGLAAQSSGEQGEKKIIKEVCH